MPDSRDPKDGTSGFWRRSRFLQGAASSAAAKQMVADHEEAVGLFKSEAAAGEANADLNAFAQPMLATLEHHKSMADALASQHGGAYSRRARCARTSRALRR